MSDDPGSGIATAPDDSAPSLLPAALTLFAVWTAATYFLEGLPRTLLRPEAAGLRLTYAVAVNVGVGLIGAMWILRRAVVSAALGEYSTGFGGGQRAWIGTAAGAALGTALFVAQQPPTLGGTVVLNAFSQVLVVSIAEVLVCWAVVGASLETSLRRRNVPLPRLWAAIAASALFGIYHLAHSPPFNSLRMVLLLTMVGLITSAFFFTVRSAYGTIFLHNFLGLFGVLEALARRGRLESLQRPNVALLVTAAGALGLLLMLHRAWLHTPGALATTHTNKVTRS
ncbi:MAG TPA: hypothetical protein VFZ56_14130 [Gemmatimonadaceae bacterium]